MAKIIGVNEELSKIILSKDPHVGTEKKEPEAETESIVLNITEKSVDLLPETLQVGDYIPFIEIKGEGRKKHIHNYCNSKPFMFVTIKNLNDIDLHETFLNLSNNFDVIVLFEEGNPVNTGTNVLYTKDVQLKKYFDDWR